MPQGGSFLDKLLLGIKAVWWNGTPVTPRPTINFLGGVVADNSGLGTTDVTLGGSSGGGGGVTTVESNGTAQPLRTAINFVGLDVTDDSPHNRTNVTLDLANSSITGILSVPQGGTGAASLPAGAVLLGNGTSTVGNVPPGTVGNVLTSTGASWNSAAAASDFTPGGDLQTSTSTLQWVSSISGAGGNGGIVGINIDGFQTQQSHAFVWNQQPQALGLLPENWTVVAQQPDPGSVAPSFATPANLDLDVNDPIGPLFVGSLYSKFRVLAGFTGPVAALGPASSYGPSQIAGALWLGTATLTGSPATQESTYALFGAGSYLVINSPTATGLIYYQFAAGAGHGGVMSTWGPMYGGAPTAGQVEWGMGVGCQAIAPASVEPTTDPSSGGGAVSTLVQWASSSTRSFRQRGPVADIGIAALGPTASQVGVGIQAIKVTPVATVCFTSSTTPTVFLHGIAIPSGLMARLEYRLNGSAHIGGNAFSESGRFVCKNVAGTITFSNLSTGTLGLGNGQVADTTSLTGAPMLTASDAGSGNVQFFVTSPDATGDDWTLHVTGYIQ